MTYENDVHNSDYVTVEYFDVFTCIKNTVYIHILKLNLEVWTILTMGRSCFSRHFNTVKFKFNFNENIQNHFNLIWNFMTNIFVYNMRI